MKYKKYGECALLTIILLFIFNLLTSIFNYFDFLPTNVIGPANIILTLLTLFIAGVFLGKKVDKKGWLEGIKIGLTIIFLFFLISYLGFDQGINLKSLIYYLTLLISPMLGSMIGINKRKER